MQIDVAQHRRNHPALRGTRHRAPYLPVLHHPRAQDRAQQLEDRLITDTFLHRLHQLLVRNRRKAFGDIRLDHPPPTPPGLVDQDLQGIVSRTLRAEPEAARQHVRFEDRLEHDLQRGLHDAVPNRRNRQRPPLSGAGLRDEDPTRRQWPIAAVLQLGGQFIEQSGYPVLLNMVQGGLVDARCAVVRAHRDPRTPQHVSAVDLVCKRVEPSSGIGLGRPVERMLQGTNRITH